MHSEKPPYRQVAEHLRDRIVDGEFKEGDQLPSERDLVRDWHIARGTATKALGLLRSPWGWSSPRLGEARRSVRFRQGTATVKTSTMLPVRTTVTSTCAEPSGSALRESDPRSSSTSCVTLLTMCARRSAWTLGPSSPASSSDATSACRFPPFGPPLRPDGVRRSGSSPLGYADSSSFGHGAARSLENHDVLSSTGVIPR